MKFRGRNRHFCDQ